MASSKPDIEAIHRRSRATYGVPRVHAELRAEGTRVGRKRVARLMRRAGLEGASRRKRAWTTKRDREARPAPDLVERDFSSDGPDRLWVADITYIPTWSGFLYLAVVLDAWSRKIVGWAMATHLRTELVLDALNMALGQRRGEDVIHHSDQGCQYTSIAFGLRCKEAGVRPSMGSVADCYDNAMCESFFATVECELLEQKPRAPRPRLGWRSSTSSKAGTTRIGGTRRWTTGRQESTNERPERWTVSQPPNCPDWRGRHRVWIDSRRCEIAAFSGLHLH